jgi:hypothetical protein
MAERQQQSPQPAPSPARKRRKRGLNCRSHLAGGALRRLPQQQEVPARAARRRRLDPPPRYAPPQLVGIAVWLRRRHRRHTKSHAHRSFLAKGTNNTDSTMIAVTKHLVRLAGCFIAPKALLLIPLLSTRRWGPTTLSTSPLCAWHLRQSRCAHLPTLLYYHDCFCSST